jgi:hypothetical protein
LKVLGNGELLEFDRPSVLLSNSDSYFVSLVEQTGRSEAKHLRLLANRMDLRIKQEPIVDNENESDPLLNAYSC